MSLVPSRTQLWTVVASLMAVAGMWLYAQRVLISFQVSDAAAHSRPRGNLSDLYPRWVGAKALLQQGRNPYGADVSREIQAGYYGRPLDPGRAEDPRDQQGFAYPVYVVFFLAPTIDLPFAIVQRYFFWTLLSLTCLSAVLWIRVLRWPLPFWSQAGIVLLTLGSVAVMQGVKLQQMSLLVAAFVAVAIILLILDQALAAGVLLALATIKPQLLLLLLLSLIPWTYADLRRRYRWALSFLLTMAVLVGASEAYLPGWLPLFWRAVHDYQNYTGAMSVMDKAIGTPWSQILELIAFAASAGVCWRERRQPETSAAFAFMIALVLSATVLLIPTFAPYNQVLLIPACLLLVKERRSIWNRNTANRLLFGITAILILWPWIASATLTVLSFVMARQAVQRGWAIPAWTVTQIPIAVTALMLIHYYQQTFPAQTKAGAS
jgi:glycosyl transferase family 87